MQAPLATQHEWVAAVLRGIAAAMAAHNYRAARKVGACARRTSRPCRHASAYPLHASRAHRLGGGCDAATRGKSEVQESRPLPT
jgi:hypothetical protein